MLCKSKSGEAEGELPAAPAFVLQVPTEGLHVTMDNVDAGGLGLGTKSKENKNKGPPFSSPFFLGQRGKMAELVSEENKITVSIPKAVCFVRFDSFGSWPVGQTLFSKHSQTFLRQLASEAASYIKSAAWTFFVFAGQRRNTWVLKSVLRFCSCNLTSEARVCSLMSCLAF